MISSPERRFDIILSSHIVQHMPIALAQSLIMDMANALVPGGILVLTATYEHALEDTYVVESIGESGSVMRLHVDLNGFEQAMGQNGKLPVRGISEKSMKKMFEDAGLNTEEILPFHFLGQDDASKDTARRKDNDMLDIAKDAMYLCRKPS